jgi:uncharacterized protein DUF2797
MKGTSVKEQHIAWRSTGLHWEAAAATLTAAPFDPATGRAGGAEHRRLLAPGQHLGWRLVGPRRCVGIWSGAERIACPAGTPIAEAGTDAQCRACASGDKGRALARDAITDDRTFALYLAWFGPEMVKVGITAEDRGRDRLLEQGAIAYTLLATGPHTSIRQAERAVAASGLATERISAQAKANAWWTLPDAAKRAEHLAAIHTAIVSRMSWPERTIPAGCQIVDQAADFALTRPPPASYAELTAAAHGSVLAGQITAIIGRRLLLDTPTGPLLADMRRIAGWQLVPTAPDSGHLAKPTGLAMVLRDRPRADHDNQDPLF